MYSEFLRIQQSIDAILTYRMIQPHFRWIRLFEKAFRSEAGVQEKTQLLMKQLRDIEL
jgi:hypothetical protein